ncbi:MULTISPECIES: diaminopimelate decarboxylase [Streptomyces]|uniref:diaminopimelate decarboxylase n=1 Tax=Streptomyces TaxID=1883 RepID=UPI001039506C|nr:MULTISPECIES: diaminopimelate decarboxylase [Streptomyces]MBT3073217.1 diaminopimelate decarboxylase [Streptomyces sp. COG21]MBT3081620.1 diaminopimelate decarboxylase [Streptomyces sp. COG20]MBT3085208.1 diaminopimelate decarboxylase [Streptomyces sp. CYG21]MBT3096756.1 diaminopimelate decarboxylase [Streptomyces sp. CBG30]MBT3105549.1 diaminopimelate decarboxylase [Streptomyces sp. COG19]
MTGEFRIQGLGINRLTEEFGTPLYLYDGDVLRAQFEGLRAPLHPALEMFFSLKANPNVSVCALLRSLGARAEVSSMAELVTALRAGVPAHDIIFLGPGKSREEIAACLTEGILATVVESFEELALVDELAAEQGVLAPVALRVNPGFAVKGSGLTMGGKPRQFGIDEEQVLAAEGLAERHPHVRLMGVHAYLGTRILDENVIVENSARILDLAERVSERLGFTLELVDVGGGLGVGYFEKERDLDPKVLADGLNPLIESFARAHPTTRLLLELGRYLTAPAGTYVVRVRYVKTSLGESFAVADGGTNHHMAAVGIGSFVKRNFPMRLLNRLDEPADQPWVVTGPLCTPNDTLGKNVSLPPVRAGDLIGVDRSGAYGPTASPVLFLSHGYPAEVLVDGGRAHLVRDRDTTDDLLGRQHRYHPPATGAGAPTEGK